MKKCVGEWCLWANNGILKCQTLNTGHVALPLRKQKAKTAIFKKKRPLGKKEIKEIYSAVCVCV